MPYKKTIKCYQCKFGDTDECENCGNNQFIINKNDIPECPKCNSINVSGGWLDHQSYCEDCGWTGILD